MEFDYNDWYRKNKDALCGGTVNIRDLMLKLHGKNLIIPTKRDTILAEHGEDIQFERLYDHLVRAGVQAVPDIIYCLERTCNGRIAKLFRDGVPIQPPSQQAAAGILTPSPSQSQPDVWTVKQDALTRSCNGAMIGLLLEKRDRWIPANNSTEKLFIAAHPMNARWSDAERSKVLSHDFQNFDMSMTAKWLQQFPWLPHEPALTPNQRNAVVELCKIRNTSAHAGYGQVVRKDQFAREYERARQNLQILGVDQARIAEIINEAMA